MPGARSTTRRRSGCSYGLAGSEGTIAQWVTGRPASVPAHFVWPSRARSSNSPDHHAMLGHRRPRLVTPHHVTGLPARHSVGEECGRVCQPRPGVVAIARETQLVPRDGSHAVSARDVPAPHWIAEISATYGDKYEIRARREFRVGHVRGSPASAVRPTWPPPARRSLARHLRCSRRARRAGRAAPAPTRSGQPPDRSG